MPDEAARKDVASVADEARNGQTDEPGSQPVRFSPDEEAALVKESQSIKTEANNLFSSRDYHNALARYEDAVASCPKYLFYDRAVLQSNIAAAHLKLEQWQDAIKAATEALDGLVELEKEGAALPSAADKADDTAPNQPDSKSTSDAQGRAKDVANTPVVNDADEEIVSRGALKSAPAPPPEAETPSAAETRKACARSSRRCRRAQRPPRSPRWPRCGASCGIWATASSSPLA
ncbi:hypothetical protein HIM_00932 [Hirsutella minnesotensis 3608]|nr:hypothetical protein HIM_00932 [Hirsutella minnesotensis 3608]